MLGLSWFHIDQTFVQRQYTIYSPNQSLELVSCQKYLCIGFVQRTEEELNSLEIDSIEKQRSQIPIMMKTVSHIK